MTVYDELSPIVVEYFLPPIVGSVPHTACMQEVKNEALQFESILLFKSIKFVCGTLQITISFKRLEIWN